MAKISEYITVKETAEAWGVSRRYVNLCIQDGCVNGAVRMSNMWLVPKGTLKPVGLHRVKGQSAEKSLSSDLAYVIEMTTKSIPKDNPDAILDLIDEEWLRLYCEGTLAYLRCDYKRVIQCFHKISDDKAVKLRYCSLAIATAISTGDYPLYLEIETFCKDMIKTDKGTDVKTIAEYTLSTAYIGAYVPGLIPGWLKDGDFSALPLPLRSEAICKYTKYLIFLKKYESVFDIAHTALAFENPELGISYSSYYLRIMLAVACCNLNRMDDAEKYLREAMAICLPHGFITPFAENMPLFCGLLERLLKREYPMHYDAVIESAEHTIKNWLAYHNRITKDNITLILSSREYQMARLAAQGVPNKDIAKLYHITVGSLNNTMQKIYEKLFISGRKELVNYIL